MPSHAPACVSDLVARFRPIGKASIVGTLHDLKSYPGLLLGGDSIVHGYLCELPDDDLLWRRLDSYEGFDPLSERSSLFRRVPAAATLEDGRRLDCQTYVYNRPVSPASVVASGDWTHRSVRPASALPTRVHSMARPIIGITSGSCDDNPSRYEIPADYARSVERAGGLPFMLPFRTNLSLIPELLDTLAGIVFVGGNDLDPVLWGETWHPKAVPVDPQRQTFELALIAEAERRRMPSLGVCMGSQLMNVHRGGSLHQFIPDLNLDPAVEHRHLGDTSYRHDVQVKPGTLLAEVVGVDRLSANSRHKQAMGRIGRGLRVSAVAPDGVVEAVEDPDLPMFMAVQWHPENLAAESPEHLRLFERLVTCARQNAAAARR